MGKSDKISNSTTPPAKRTGRSGAVSPAGDISSFLEQASVLKSAGDGRGGLIFAMDATMSREHTWDQAQRIQAQMFDAVDSSGALDVQLVYFRGFGECRASRWVSDASSLRDLMTGIACRGGQTQIGKVLAHVRKEAGKRGAGTKGESRVNAVVYVGDAMEENPDTLCQTAGELGLLNTPVFMFLEGQDGQSEKTFREIARLSGGAFMRFGPGSAAQLAELLKAVARFATGGRKALAADTSAESRLLLEQMS